MDMISATPRPDLIDGRAGDDLLSGLGGNDILIGGDGADYFAFSSPLTSTGNGYTENKYTGNRYTGNAGIEEDEGDMFPPENEESSPKNEWEDLLFQLLSVLPEKTRYHDGIDTILDFSRSEGDRIDFSLVSIGLGRTLSFSGTVPTPYSIYYSVGVDPDHNVLLGTRLINQTRGDGITLFADLDGNPQSPEMMTVIWGWVYDDPLTGVMDSDLIV